MEANALTVLAVLVAGYTLLAEQKRIDLKLRFSWVDKTVILLLVTTVLYTIYLPVLYKADLALPLPWLWGFNERLTAFTAIVIILLYLTVKLSGSKLPKSKLLAWRNVSCHLLRNQKFEALTFLLDKYHCQLIESLQDRWYDKLRTWLQAPYTPSISELYENEKSGGENKDNQYWSRFKSDSLVVLRPLVLLIAKSLPDSHNYRHQVSQSISDLLKSNLFVKHLTHTQPLLCARLTIAQFNSNDEFTAAFFKELIANSGSPLYRELKDNQNCSSTGEYYIDESNILLSFYLTNIDVVAKVGAWQPVGEYTKELISRYKGADSYYNQPFSYTYLEDKKWECPIFVSLQFFDVMVSRAIHRGYKDHMFLVYLEYFVNEILKAYKPAPEVDTDEEFPTIFGFLIYRVLDVLTTWVESASYNPDEETDIRIDHTLIPVRSAARALGCTLYSLFESRKLDDRQYKSYLDMVVRLMKKLDRSENEELSKLIVDNAIRKFEPYAPDTTVVNSLIEYYSQIDHVLWRNDSTFEKELKKVTGKDIR